VYRYAQPSYTTQHGTVLIVFRHNLQTIIVAQMLSVRGEEKVNARPEASGRIYRLTACGCHEKVTHVTGVLLAAGDDSRTVIPKTVM